MRLLLAILAVFGLAILSLFVGVEDLSLAALVSGKEDSHALLILLASRIPRTIALVLAGMSMAVAGYIMQMLARNRFVEPSTAGTVESAGLGILTVMIIAPGLPIFGRMIVATLFAIAGTALFLRIIQQIRIRSPFIVPLVGIMLAGIISSLTTFLAYRFDLLQSLGAWMTGDFSTVLRGRYELLWISFVLTGIAYYAADRFTVAGMGENFTTNLGMNYARVMALGLTIVSMVTAVVTTTVGVIPFVGLVVPNIVSLTMGDNARRSIPWIGLVGALFVLSCDIIGRIVRYPYEIPVGTILGVVGSAVFLYLLLRRGRCLA
ncbi:ABC transporter permease [Methyloligella solikamskensis]|uniref:ABC transporter permease n=1 Tax=Methyloligella solikamskensis TaxID=1177756 RepID=A0ABW3JC99_9HYPH